MLRVLAISGSLRQGSSNTALLRAAAALSPAGMEITLYEGLASLPHFSPDLEGLEPATVLEYRAQLRAAAAVLVSSPEYAHGVPGSLKNALDWVVGSGELVGKPVGLWNPSPRGTFAQAQLIETLTVMSALLLPEASLTLPHLSGKLEAAALLAHPDYGPQIRSALAALAQALG